MDYENTFVRGPSPSYSTDEVSSENALSLTLPIDAAADDFYQNVDDSNNLNYFDEKSSGMLDCDYAYVNYAKRLNRKTFAFWTIVVILLLLTISNLVLTMIIIGVLHLGKGIQGMEMIPEVDVIKFYGITDLDRVYTKNIGQIEGFSDVPVTITGDDSAVSVRVFKNGVLNDRIILDKEGIVVRATNLFEIKDPKDKTAIFTTHRPQYNVPNGVDVLLAKSVSASRVTSPIDEPLVMASDGRIAVKGSEGIAADAGAILVQAEHIAINASQGATILEAGGIFLDMDRVPIVSSELGLRTGSVQYKICVCMPQGTVFRIAIPRVHNGPKITCAHFSAKQDPCGLN